MSTDEKILTGDVVLPLQGSRIAYIDTLRSLMIVLVVMMHAAVTYSGFGMWYYKEIRPVDFLSSVLFGAFQTFTQAYFMSLLFMIAGYFTFRSLRRKGVGFFVRDRLFRLGIPIIVYIVIIHPLCVKMSNPAMDIGAYCMHGLLSLECLSWTGPLWFAVAVLLFSFAYVPFRGFFEKRRIILDPSVKNVLFLVLFIGSLAFIIRLGFPIGTDVLNLQFSFFSSYIVMFFIGIAGSGTGLFERISYHQGKKWLIVSIALGIPFWCIVMLFGGPVRGIFLINGGFYWQALAYALWESFFCVTFSVALLGIFAARMNRQNALLRFFSDNGFGVFVFHAPILIGVSIMFKAVAVPPLLKWLFVFLCATPLCFIWSFMVRKVRWLRVVFS